MLYTYERRAFPRIAVESTIKISDRAGQVVNISETGLSFLFPKAALNRPFIAEFQLGSETVKVGVNLIWQRARDPDMDLNGGRFVDISKEERFSLRRLLFFAEIEPFLVAITGDEDREKVRRFFLKDVYSYFTAMQTLIEELKVGQASLADAESQLTRLTDEVLTKGDELENSLKTKAIFKSIKAHFRHLTSPWAYKGIIVKRALDKPQGYPGDYLLLEAIYDNETPSQGIGICSDRYFLNNSYSTAVRNRLEKTKEILKNFIANGHPNDEVRILNIACGSVRELSDLLSEDPHLFTGKKLRVTCFDQDKEALDFCRQRLEDISYGASFEFIQGNVLEFLERRAPPSTSRYHLIYSMGLADYLPDRVLKRLVVSWVELLEPKGTLVFTHKDFEISKPLAPDWFCDWNFYPRTEEKIRRFLASAPLGDFRLKIKRENSQQIVFFILEKKP